MADFEEVVTTLEPPAGSQGAVAAPVPRGGQVMLTWGSAAFGASTATYDRLRRRVEHRWPSQDRIGRRPTLESTGAGRDEITLEGVLMPTYRAGALQAIEALRMLVAAGKPELLTAGDGHVYGEWVGLVFEDTCEHLFDNGRPRQVTYTLKLAHSGEDTPGGLETATEQAAGDQKVLGRFVSRAEVASGLPTVTPSSLLEEAQAAAEGAEAGSQPQEALAAMRAERDRGGNVKEILRAMRGVAARIPGAGDAVEVARVAYRAADGDTVADIARRRYGSASAVPAILNATRGLAGEGSHLHAGTLVGLPEDVRPAQAVERLVDLWE
ncbi:MAG: hypothetical protein F4Y57_05145 [Acidobacteria bacterium]|nr:hypothetical protein [Acidobacteriota bacterium]